MAFVLVFFLYNARMQGKLFLIVGPSGSGKGTIINRLKKKYTGFFYPVSYTTRDPRPGEKDGDVYHFVTKKKFEERLAKGDFLEYAVVHSNNYYGTAKKKIMDALEGGAVIVREVDIQGFLSIAKIIPKKNLVSIFMKVADEEDLKQRILRRGDLPADELLIRMRSAKKEIAQAKLCDYEVENKWGEVDDCLFNVEQIILEEIKYLY